MRKAFPVVAAEVETAGMYVPVTPDEIFATESVAAAFVIPAHAPVSWNFTGTVLPSVNTELPFALIGGWIANGWHCTSIRNDRVALLPAGLVAVQFTVVVPGGNVEPDAGEQLKEPPGSVP